jgi:hypothetical protein
MWHRDEMAIAAGVLVTLKTFKELLAAPLVSYASRLCAIERANEREKHGTFNVQQQQQHTHFFCLSHSLASLLVT